MELYLETRYLMWRNGCEWSLVKIDVNGSVTGDGTSEVSNTVVRNMNVGMNRPEQHEWNCVWKQGIGYAKLGVCGTVDRSVVDGSVVGDIGS